MKKYFKLVFYLLCSISFLVYKVLLAIQTYSLFNGLEPFYLAYQLFYNICITLLTLLFVYKLIVTFLDIFQEKFKIRRVLFINFFPMTYRYNQYHHFIIFNLCY